VDAFAGLDWDDGNIEKCKAHGVTTAEIASLFSGEPFYSPDEVHSVAEQRLIAVGLTEAGRALFVVFTIRERNGRRLVRPLSARYMHAKEARRYGLAKGSRPQN
jgi:uncharacterized DUF497 family protein